MAFISGPSSVCSSGTQFTVNSVPSGCTVSWTCSTNISFDNQNGNPKTFSANGNGIGTIQATIISGCGNITIPQKEVWVGLFEPNTTELTFSNAYDGQGVFCSNSYGNQFELPVPAINSCYYEYKLTNLAGTQVIDQNYSYTGTGILNNSGLTPGYYLFWVRGISGCEVSDWYSTEVEYIDCSQLYLSLSPNPSATETTISIVSKSNTKIDENIEWDLEVYDSMQNLKTKTQKLKGDKQTINTTGWKDGVYIVRVKIGKEVISEKLVVKH